MPASRHHDEQPRCDECNAYGDCVEAHDAYLCAWCERNADECRDQEISEEARSYFDKATVLLKAERDQDIGEWWGDRTPVADRRRDAIAAKFKTDTAEAQALYDRTFDELKATGEISEELSFAWDALIEAQKPKLIIVGDHQPEQRVA